MFIVRCGMHVRRVLTLTLLAIGATAASASATDFIVNTATSDLPDREPGNGVCATIEGLCTLRAAVMEAAAAAGDPHLITIPPGLYKLTSHRNEDGGREGDLDIRVPSGGRRLTIRGAGAPPSHCATTRCTEDDLRGSTIIEGSSSGDRVFDIWWYATVVIEHVGITGGALPPLRGFDGENCRIDDGEFTLRVSDRICDTGGGIRSRSDLTLNHVTVYRNAAGFGGGIHSMASMTLNNVAVAGNSTYHPIAIVDGRAIWRPWFCGGGILHQGGTLTISGSLIDSNTSTRGGGGICTLGDTEIRNTTISRNRSTVRGHGGGLLLQPPASYSFGTPYFHGVSLSMFDSVVRDNRVRDGNGGGIRLGGIAELHNVRIENNRASGPGGGIAVQGDYDGPFTLSSLEMLALRAADLTAAGNWSDSDGGGVFLGGGARVRRSEILSSTIAENHSSRAGAGLYAANHDVSLTNVTISSNTAVPPEGAGVSALGAGLYFTESTAELFHTTVAFNWARTSYGGGLFAHNSSVTLKANFFYQNWWGGCYFDGIRPISLGGNRDDTNTCPLDGPHVDVPRPTHAGLDPHLANNGGLTQTHALHAGSWAIDFSDCIAASGAALTVDQRGVPRPSGARCDTGAYELVQINLAWLHRLGQFGRMFFVMLDGARLMLAEMIRENNPNVNRANDLVRELELASLKLGAGAEAPAPEQLMALIDELTAQLSRAEQTRLSFDDKALGVSAVRWKSLRLLGARAQEHLTAVKASLAEPRQ